MKTILTILLLLVMSLPLASALDITALAQNSGTIKVNRVVQTKIETALGIDINSLSGTKTGTVTVIVNKILQIGNIYIIIANINEKQYTIIVPSYKVLEYTK